MSPSSSYNRRERPAKPALSRDGIVATATDLMLREGIERVTMRRLARELDTGPASLYVYLRDTDELHAAVLDGLLAGVELAPDERDWRERLWRVMSSYREVLYAYPSLARVALVGRLSGTNYLATVDAILGLLDEGGMTGIQAAWTVDMLLLIANAEAVEHGPQNEDLDPDENHDQLFETVRSVPAESYPHIAALSAELLSGSSGARSRWAFETLLSGAAVTRPPVTDS